VNRDFVRPQILCWVFWQGWHFSRAIIGYDALLHCYSRL
jgi:hypothetical protein